MGSNYHVLALTSPGRFGTGGWTLINNMQNNVVRSEPPVPQRLLNHEAAGCDCFAPPLRTFGQTSLRLEADIQPRRDGQL